jgi:predicted DNA-binding transcriptional regulator AlpA
MKGKRRMKARGEGLTKLPATLHPEQRLTAQQVMQLSGRGRSKLYADMALGRLPQPSERDGRFVRWRAGDVLAALQRGAQ